MGLGGVCLGEGSVLGRGKLDVAAKGTPHEKKKRELLRHRAGVQRMGVRFSRIQFAPHHTHAVESRSRGDITRGRS